MKIIYLHQYFNTPQMSGGTRSFEMARRLVKWGHEVHVVTSWREPHDSSNWFETNEEGVQVHWFPLCYSNSMGYGTRLKAFFAFAWHAARRATSIGGDLVFATSTPLTIALPGVYAASRLHVPMVFEVRDLWPEMPIAIGALRNPLLKWLARRLEKWAYDHATAIVALSPEMKDGIVASGYPAEKVAVIPNSSDNTLFGGDDEKTQHFRAARPWLGDRPLILYAGTFGRVNNVGWFVAFAQELMRVMPEARILLVGKGAEYEMVKKQAHMAGVLDVTLFIEPPIAKEEVPTAFAAADIACSVFLDVPQMQANSANKFFDTLAASRPIMLNYGGWQAELVQKHQCGLVLWRQPLDEAARSMAALLSDQSRLVEAGRAARGLAEQYFDRDSLARDFAAVLQCAAEGKADMAESWAPGVYR